MMMLLLMVMMVMIFMDINHNFPSIPPLSAIQCH